MCTSPRGQETHRHTTAWTGPGDRRRGAGCERLRTNKSRLSSDPPLRRRTRFLPPPRLCEPTAEARKQPGLSARDKTITINLGSSRARRQTARRLDSVTGAGAGAGAGWGARTLGGPGRSPRAPRRGARGTQPCAEPPARGAAGGGLRAPTAPVTAAARRVPQGCEGLSASEDKGPAPHLAAVQAAPGPCTLRGARNGPRPPGGDRSKS